MPDLAANLAAVRNAIEVHAREFHRDPAGIRLLAVSKTFPATAIADLRTAGQQDFGENYLQEALQKVAALRDAGATWHFIGRVQSNKTRELAERFDWVQTVDRERIARRLNDHRPVARAPLNICLQVNLDREPQKAGVAPEDVLAMAEAIAQMPRLVLRGLMAIPAARENFDQQRATFRQLRLLFEQLRAEGYAVDTLSMGMSGDMRAAIAEGSTLLRIGTALFGARG